MDEIMRGLAERQRADADAELQAEKAEKAAIQARFDQISQAVVESTAVLIRFLQEHQTKAEVTNFPAFPTSIETPDIDRVVEAVKSLETSLAPVGIDNSDIIKGLESIGQKIEAMPGPSTEPLEIANIDGLKKTLSSDLKAILTALRGIEVKPKITLPAPVVNVPETDLTPIIKAVATTTEAVKKLKFPVSTTPTDPLILYTQADLDDANADGTVKSIQYIGYTQVGGAWYIQRFDKSTAPKTIRFAFGQAGYVANWGNRANLNYTIWGQ